jgi:hypothetical protein
MLPVSRLKFPIAPLVNEMLDQLPAEIWTSSTTTFLDPAMAGGQFLVEIQRRLREAGHTDENIASRMFGCETNKLRVNYSKNNKKLVTDNLWISDFLSRDWGTMKFDVIIGNPPYQSNESSQKKLWPLFIEKSYNIISPNGYIAMVVPASWLVRPDGRGYSNLTKNIFGQNHLVWISADAKKYFDIGETVAAWVLHCNNSIGNTTALVNNGITTSIVYSGQLVALTSSQAAVYNIMSKIDNFDRPKLKSLTYNDVQGRSIEHYLESKTLFENKAKDRVKVFWTAANSEQYWTPKKNQRQGIKIIVNLSGYYYSETEPSRYMLIDLNNTYAIGAGSLGIPFDNKESAENCWSFLKSKLYQFYINNEKTSGFNTGIIKLPLLDTKQAWTDELVCDAFGLTQEEKELVYNTYQRKTSS